MAASDSPALEMLLLKPVSLEAHRELLVKPVSLLRPFQRHASHIPTGSRGMRPDVQSEGGSKGVVIKKRCNRWRLARSSVLFFILLCIYFSIFHCVFVCPNKIIDLKHQLRW